MDKLITLVQEERLNLRQANKKYDLDYNGTVELTDLKLIAYIELQTGPCYCPYYKYEAINGVLTFYYREWINEVQFRRSLYYQGHGVVNEEDYNMALFQLETLSKVVT